MRAYRTPQEPAMDPFMHVPGSRLPCPRETGGSGEEGESKNKTHKWTKEEVETVLQLTHEGMKAKAIAERPEFSHLTAHQISSKVYDLTKRRRRDTSKKRKSIDSDSIHALIPTAEGVRAKELVKGSTASPGSSQALLNQTAMLKTCGLTYTHETATHFYVWFRLVHGFRLNIGPLHDNAIEYRMVCRPPSDTVLNMWGYHMKTPFMNERTIRGLIPTPHRICKNVESMERIVYPPPESNEQPQWLLLKAEFSQDSSYYFELEC